MVIKTLPIPPIKSNTNPSLPSKKSSRLSQSVSLPPSDYAERHSLPNANDLRRMCIITKSDLNRIYDNLERRQREKEAIEQEIQRKKEMSERSAEITKHWPNTILGMRERKLQLKTIREEKEEERRKVLDIEEEKIAAERRREQIEKAKQLQYYKTDHVRKFHSALLLSEVLKERDTQLEMNKRLAQMRQDNEDAVRKRYEEAQIEFQKAEQEKMEQRAKDRASLARYQLAQMEQRRGKSFEEKQKDREEGEEYRRLAQQNALELFELEQLKKQNKKDVREMYDKAMDDKRKVKQMEQELDEEEEEDLRVYAEAKKKMARLRREKELQVHREKQQARDEMIGYLGSLQKRAEADFSIQIIKARAEREAKDQREEQEKLVKEQKMNEAITKHRHETIKRRAAEKEIEEREDENIRRKKEEANYLYGLYLEEKQRQRKQDAQNNSQSHLKQIQERNNRQREMKSNEYDEVQTDKHLNEVERQQFQDYAGRVIAFMEENGRNTYPMKKVVADEMKRFDEVSQGYQQSATVANTNGKNKPGNPNIQTLDDTKKHLGFQWNIPQ